VAESDPRILGPRDRDPWKKVFLDIETRCLHGVERADVIVTNLRESVVSEKQGDLYEPIEKGLVKLEDIIELGELAAGARKGRTTDEQITYHKNNNGTAAAEIAVAMLAYELAKKEGRGTMVDLIDPGEFARIAMM